MCNDMLATLASKRNVEGSETDISGCPYLVIKFA